MSGLRCLAVLLVLGISSSAGAHFTLQSPPASTEQDLLGNPQKAPPCGDEGNAVPTGVVTTYQSGTTLTLTIDETIYHPGHYRIALAVNDIGELPAEPIVTPGSTDCGSAPIMSPVAFPVLADGVFVHTSQFDGPQSIDIALPADVTCDGCILQVIEFMSEHGLNVPGGCYYHHCATIALQADPVPPTPTGDDTDEGGCSFSARRVSNWPLVLLGLGVLVGVRRQA